jgi:hypothetical protein
MKYTDDQIADAVIKYVDNWDIDMLFQYAYDEMYKYYTEDADAYLLDEFMKDNGD